MAKFLSDSAWVGDVIRQYQLLLLKFLLFCAIFVQYQITYSIQVMACLGFLKRKR